MVIITLRLILMDHVLPLDPIVKFDPSISIDDLQVPTTEVLNQWGQLRYLEHEVEIVVVGEEAVVAVCEGGLGAAEVVFLVSGEGGARANVDGREEGGG